MTILVISSLIFGLLLGHFFRWFVLLPAGVITMIVLAANSANAGHFSFLSSFLQFGAINVSLQVGYVVGVIILFSVRAFNTQAHSPTAPAADNSEGFSEPTSSAFAENVVVS
jgi:hypothetical protein